MPTKSNKQTQISPILLLANKHVRNTALVAAGIKQIGENYKFNAKYFEDFVNFNFFNGQKIKKSSKFISAGNLPKREREKVAELYAKLLKKYSITKIYAKLNLPQSPTNKSSPLETKWVFEYFKKFKSWDYKSKNNISRREILTPLTTQEAEMYAELF